MRRTSVLLALLLLQGCYLFSVDNRPCTSIGECLPGYTCVEGLCVKAGVKSIGDPCLATDECVTGAVCAEAFCDDSGRTSCEQADDCGGGGADEFLCRNNVCQCQRRCRPGCDFPSFDKCSLGQMCWLEEDQELGFCQEGHCGNRADGTPLGSCLSSEVCLEFHGEGSGLCSPMCDVLEQEPCAAGTPATGVLCCGALQNCEHIPQLWGIPSNPDNAYGICFDTGTQDEGDPCSNDPAENRFCVRGLVCLNTFCVKYCNLASPGTQPACGAGQNCIALPGAESLGLPFGWCRSL